MHTAAQIETQIHGRSAQATQPCRGARDQVQRHDVRRVLGIGIERALDRIFGFELLVGGVKPHAQRIVFKADQCRCEPGGFERIFDLALGIEVHFRTAASRRDLNRWRFAKKLGNVYKLPSSTATKMTRYFQSA